MNLYRYFMMGMMPIAEYILKKRLAKGKEIESRIQERRGCATISRPDGDVIWFHVASVGEGVAIIPLVKRLLSEYSNKSILVTSGSVTSAKILSERLPKGAYHQFIPVDIPKWVDAFLMHWKPSVGILVESEIWPNLLNQSHSRNIPLVMVNARVSQTAEKNWQRCYGLIRHLSGMFDTVLPASKNDMVRLQRLGFDVSPPVGNIKLFAEPLSFDSNVVSHFKLATDQRTIWTASCLHPEDDLIVVKTHEKIMESIPGALAIFVPRHPERSDDLERQCLDTGMKCVRLYQGNELAPSEELKNADVVLVDVIGRMGDIYELSDVVYLGGGFAKRGGHNPMEPLRQDCVVVQGADIANCVDAVELLSENNLGIRAENEQQVIQCITSLLADADSVQSQQLRAKKMCASLSHVLDNTMAGITPIIDEHIDRKHK